ncbi:MAG: hypothetical protein DRQ24_11785 [Candidatus Latescibacterota bacterium]|nr:MAG: hypothetical protein DRQ24_11785 [Candidatus Latescibacterota bacterium]
MSITEQLDLDILPDEAKREILVFYNSLLKKYKIEAKKELDEVDRFLNKYKLDLSSYKFDRDEIHER